MTMFAELKRRKVFKVGAAYLVVAWLAVQAASIGFPAFDAPPWTLRVFILVSLLGFPLALVMAWIFDATPEGIKLDTSGKGRAGVFAAAAVLIALAFGWYFYGQPSFRKGDVATPVAARANSIAVLPFANMSGKSDEEYFSDGMTEELLNVLAKVPQLQVVARTSVFQFKGQGGDVREIGRKLGVSHVVEGSIRRDGQQVRITAQLIRVADGFQVWSETYDRKLESVFALQDEIAERIGDALKLSLGVDKTAAARASIDPAAYDEYLKGRALLRARKDLPPAIAHLQAAVAKAPQFAAGWSSLSLACEVRFWYALMTPAEQAEMLACAASAAKRAAELDPGAAATEHALANVARSRFKYAEAERHYLRAMQIDPGYPDAREDYAEMLYEVGRLHDCEAAVRQLTRLDPYFIVAWTRMRDIAVFFDRRADLEEAARQALAISPESRFARLAQLEYPMVHGRAEEARAAYARIQQAQGLKGLEFLQVLVPWALGDEDVDAARLDAAIAEAPAGAASPYLVARGDIARYNDYLASAGAIPQGYYFAHLYRSKRAGHAMLRDPRVKAKLVEYGFVAYWRETGWPAGCRPLGDADFECGLDVAGSGTP